MTRRQPSRLVLSILDSCVGNDALKGDLIEEYASGRSQLWLWWQVFGSVLYQRHEIHAPTVARAQVAVVGAALVGLMCFEAVFATNVVYRVMFGPPMADIWGSAYGFHRTVPDGLSFAAPAATFLLALAGAAAAFPIGWIVGRFHRRHHQLSMAAFAIGTHLWAIVNLGLPFGVQFLSMLFLIVGMLLVGRIAASSTVSEAAAHSAKA
jgi:hypothetical protein